MLLNLLIQKVAQDLNRRFRLEQQEEQFDWAECKATLDEVYRGLSKDQLLGKLNEFYGIGTMQAALEEFSRLRRQRNSRVSRKYGTRATGLSAPSTGSDGLIEGEDEFSEDDFDDYDE
ncbi:hypothetical protein [Leptolyngbya sp. PCC 6406]|uniref:hypothetical protein n=1 Tax=Leptolyngbya sp. PCC 6406 TaxID=1173264 RepID=UPI0002ABB828|nr:hypothetical protein [Leptolyngbya sp. PCC 6406]